MIPPGYVHISHVFCYYTIVSDSLLVRFLSLLLVTETDFRLQTG